MRLSTAYLREFSLYADTAKFGPLPDISSERWHGLVQRFGDLLFENSAADAIDDDALYQQLTRTYFETDVALTWLRDASHADVIGVAYPAICKRLLQKYDSARRALSDIVTMDELIAVVNKYDQEGERP